MDTAARYVEFDARKLPRAEQFGAWASAMPAYAVSVRDPARGFDARARAWMLPPLVITRSSLPPVRFKRTREDAVRDGLDSLTLQLFLSGRGRGYADDVSFRIDAGSIAIQDAARSIEATTTLTETVTVTFPRAFLDDVLPAHNVHGLVLKHGLARALAGFIRELPESLDGAEEEAIALIPKLFRDLLAAVLGTTPTPSVATEQRPLRDRVHRYIVRNLCLPLTVEDICLATNTSRASLYRAFDNQGGVMNFVLNRRLDRARRLLNDRTDKRSIAAIAIACGFRDASEFGRAFRRRFGMAPSGIRLVRNAAHEPAIPSQVQFRGWIERDVQEAVLGT